MRNGLPTALGCALGTLALAAPAAAQDPYPRLALGKGDTGIMLTSAYNADALTRAGVPLRLAVVHRPRRRARAGSHFRIAVTLGGDRHCGRTPGRDRGRAVLRERVRVWSSGTYPTAGVERRFGAGRRTLCAYVREPGRKRWRRSKRDVEFFDALWGAAQVGHFEAPDAQWWGESAYSTHPIRRTRTERRSSFDGCVTEGPETFDAPVTDSGLAVQLMGGFRRLTPDDECVESTTTTYTVLEGPLAGQQAVFTFTDGVTFTGAADRIAGHAGACVPLEALGAGADKNPPNEVLALLPAVGCRPGRVIPVPDGEGSPTGLAYEVVIHGAEARLAPAGTVVDVLVDAERRPAPDLPPLEPDPPRGRPYPGLPPASPQPGCQATVTAGPLEAVAACWTRRGDRFESRGRVRLNGVDITPARPGIAIRLDASGRRVTSTGPVEVRIGFLRLYRGRLDWRGRSQVFSIEGRSRPRDPGEPFDVKDVSVFGLPVDGSAELRFEGGRTKLKASIEIPGDPSLAAIERFAGWSGDLTAAATNDAGLVLDGATVNFPGLQAGFVEITNAKLAVSGAAGAYHFDGGATVYPFRFARIGLGGELGFGVGDGYFRIGAGAENLNRPLLYGFFLQKVSLAAQVNPFGVAGAAGVTFGPQLRIDGQLVSAARLDGSLSYLSGGALTLAGALQLAEADIADGTVTVSGGLVDIAGNATLTLGGYGLHAGVTGWVDGMSAFNAEGTATIALPGPDGSGEAVLSTAGVAACKRGFGPDVGFGYSWGDGLGAVDLFASSCDLGPWRVIRPGADGSAAQAGGGRTFRVRRGTRTIALSAVGEQGPPDVAFVAPDGRRFQPSAAPEGVVSTEQVLLVQDAQTRTTAFAMDAPPPGRWRIVPLPGTTPVRTYRSSTALAPVKVRARVRRARGGRRVLRYRIRNRSGARVTFLEQGRDVRSTIGRTRRARGRLRFRPAPGRRGRRTVIALIERGGRPTGRTRRVTRFRVGSARPARPRKVRIRRRSRSRRLITWRGPRRLAYLVTVRTPDGRKLRYVKARGRRRVVVPHVPRRQRIRVTIRGRAPNGTLSRTTRARSRR